MKALMGFVALIKTYIRTIVDLSDVGSDDQGISRDDGQPIHVCIIRYSDEMCINPTALQLDCKKPLEERDEWLNRCLEKNNLSANPDNPHYSSECVCVCE